MVVGDIVCAIVPKSGTEPCRENSQITCQLFDNLWVSLGVDVMMNTTVDDDGGDEMIINNNDDEDDDMSCVIVM